ncbi:MAG: hypothetical protein GY940_05845, partial [bacterium]|nr:hypothetical protein [bacterium]
NHNKMEFYYNGGGQLVAVMDTMGRMMDLEYYPFELNETGDQLKGDSGRLWKVIDFADRTVEYKYFPNGDLESVDFEGRVQKYIYSANNDIKLAHNLEKVIDPMGAASANPVLTITYNNEDKVKDQEYIEIGQKIVFTPGETEATVIDAKGHSKVFTFTSDTHLEVSNSGFTTTYDFNDDHLLTGINFPGGNSVAYEYYPVDENNRRSAGNLNFARNIPGPAGGETLVTEYKYQTWTNQVNSIKDPKGNETIINRDSKGNIDSVELPGIAQPYVYEYYTPGEPKIYGVLESITDPEGNVTGYEYYPETAPSGDGTGTPHSRDMNATIGGYTEKVSVDKNGVNIFATYIYNRLGNLVETRDGEGVKTIYDYIDESGKTNPFGEVQTLTQGASGSNDGRPPANLTTTFKYDENGNVDLEISSTGITIDYGYDRLNRVTTKSYQGGTEVMTYGFQYNDNSNLERVTYPDGVRKETFTYNSRDLLESKTSG